MNEENTHNIMQSDSPLQQAGQTGEEMCEEEDLDDYDDLGMFHKSSLREK